MVVDIDVANKAALDIVRISEQLKPRVSEKDFVEKFLLTLYAYHKGENVDISYWLKGLKSDGTLINATPFQNVQIVDNNQVVVGYVPPIVVDPTGVLPPEVRENLHDLLDRAEKMEKAFPGRGKAFMRNNITEHVVDKSSEKEKLRILWDGLFVKYGLDPVYSTKLGDNATGSGDLIDDGEFDAVFL